MGRRRDRYERTNTLEMSTLRLRGIAGGIPAVRGDDDAAEAAWFQLQYHMSRGTLALKLSREEEVLRARVQAEPRQTALGTEYHLGAFESDGIAFDHCKMIAQAILKLRAAGRL